jgi:hypothetical protein
METTNQSGSDEVASYGLLAINQTYNKGKITFKQWLELSRQWALQTKEQRKGENKKKNK